MARTSKKGIGIRTWPTERIPLGQLNAASYNPRKISTSARRGLKSSLSRWGMVEFIVWNKQTGNVVGGHQRLQLLADEKATHADCVVVDLPSAEEKALNIALNNPKIQGEFTGDLEALASEIHTDLPDLPKDLGLDRLLSDVLSSQPSDDPENEIAETSATSTSQSETESGTQATIGEYRFEIDRAAYEKWKEDLRQEVGFQKADLIAELKRRLGL